jgi:hypothetical protein
MKFKPYATIKNFAQAIQRTAEADLPPTEDPDVSSDDKRRLALQLGATTERKKSTRHLEIKERK